MKLILFTGPECHLCDLALNVLQSSKHFSNLDIEKVNIRSNTDLFHLYGARIPVIKRLDNQLELGWPFDEQMVEAFLS